MAVVVPKLRLNNGQEMPVLGLGTWKSEPGEVAEVVKQAVQLGYRHFDCAHLYGNEREVGEGLAAKIAEGVVSREDLFVTSKLWNTFHRGDLVVPACRSSLADLGLDYLDLYLVHWPMAFQEGGDLMPANVDGKTRYSAVDYVDTWLAMEQCVTLGLVRSIGVSNFSSQQLERVLAVAKIKPVVNQVESHPWLSQAKLLYFCKARDVVLTAYGPLGSPYRPLPRPGDVPLLQEPLLVQIAARHAKSAAQVALRYQVQRGVAVIPKSVQRTRLQENMDLFDFELSSQELALLDSLSSREGGRLCHLEQFQDHPHYPFSVEF